MSEDGSEEECLEEEARYLLANGVVVPPVKVGDTVYCIRYDKTRKAFVKPLPVRSVTIWEKGKFTLFTSREDYLGKTVFLTKEEAEQALKGGEKE
jgi:parvulin-like peptidyl-prolyl isomerase